MKHPADYRMITIPESMGPHPEARAMTQPTTKVAVASRNGIKNAMTAMRACREAGLPYYAACALLEKESHGANLYGHDAGGALSGYPNPVTQDNFEVFWWLVQGGMPSNGVGPCQITYPGYFPAMQKEGMKPWVLHDNMVYGFRLLLAAYNAHGQSWEGAGTAYNGAAAYGADLAAKVTTWRQRFGLA